MKIIKKTVFVAGLTTFALVLCLMAAALALTACGQRVTLRFETNGGTALESVEGAAGASYKIPGDPEKEGYYFDGWYLTEDLSGEREELPEKMPEKSTTYYAKYGKYPVLSLSAEGGELSKSEHLVKPGVKLSEYLKDYVPQKKGLSFGGWFLGDVPLGEDVLMPEEDLSLSARYRADYTVDVYLQKADSPLEFERSETLSSFGSDWEGELLAPEVAQIDHFLLDETRSPVRTKTLRAGENALSFYYLRQEVTLTCLTQTESGTHRQTSKSRYGAHVSLEACGVQREGYVFYGWAENENAPARYFSGDALEMGAEDRTLYGCFAKRYPDASGEGALDVEEYGENGTHSALYRKMTSDLRGTFKEDSLVFRTEQVSGRIDANGYCLTDDSGSYEGYRLKEGRKDERFGTLELDFWGGTAVYACDGERSAGNYEYIFENGAYPGIYRFSGEGQSFLFELSGDAFVREGEEKGEYALAQEDVPFGLVTLRLDGFGNAVLTRAGKHEEANYLGSGVGDWKFEGEESFRFTTAKKVWSDENGAESEPVFFRYREELAGVYRGSGTLILDGYGLSGEYLLAGERIEGNFVREGVFVTLYGARTLRFTLCGEQFSLTGAEAGSYEGESGVLFLDGAGGGTLAGAEGSYRTVGENEYVFEPAYGSAVRLKLKGKAYLLYDRAAAGAYQGAYGSSLTLDGYGFGVYTMYDLRPLEVEVSFFDGDLICITSASLSEPLYFKLRPENKLSLIESPEVGRYALLRGGIPTDDFLVLDGSGGARLFENGALAYGSYAGNGKEIVYSSEQSERRFRLFENGTCAEYGGEGTYGGDGVLILDGFGGAIYQRDRTELSGAYVLFEGGADVYTERALYRFAFEGNAIVSSAVFSRYDGGEGTLYLEQNGTRAVMRKGAEVSEDSYTLSDGVCLLTDGFRVRLLQEKYLRYDPEKEAVYDLKNGGRLVLDGCGGGSFRRGELETSGKVVEENGYIVLVCSNLVSISGKIAFVLTDSGAEALGIEYGTYADVRGTELYLDGRGGARYGSIEGEYAEEGDEYRFTGGGLSFVFRLVRKEGAAGFEIRSSALEKKQGTYTTELGALELSSYGASLSGAELAVLYVGEDLLVVKDGAGQIWGYRFEEGTLCGASAFYEA